MTGSRMRRGWRRVCRTAGHAVALAAALAATLAAAPAHAGESIDLFIWSDYIPRVLLKRFESETGIHVNLETYDSNESLHAKLKSGTAAYDVIVPSDYMLKLMIDEGLLLEFDAQKLPHFHYVSPPLDHPAYDPERKFSGPWMWGTTGLLYDAARVPGGRLPESWGAFFAPDPALKGQVGALSDVNEIFIAASLYLRIDQCTEDPKDHQRILALLQAQRPFVAIYDSDGAIERTKAREVAMHQIWNGAARRVRGRVPTAVYMYPVEGVNFWSDNLAIPKNARNPSGATRFIDWMMDPEHIAVASAFTGYNNAIGASLKLLPAEMRADPAVNPPQAIRKRFVANRLCPAKALEMRNRTWAQFKR